MCEKDIELYCPSCGYHRDFEIDETKYKILHCPECSVRGIPASYIELEIRYKGGEE